jgi:Protein of unknown function (DUF5661)
MDIPEYVTKNEVSRVCAQLGIRDWVSLSEVSVSLEEAKVILSFVGGEARSVSLEKFRDGLQVELEHGVRFQDANITNNHPILTGRIVLAHLKESLLYYERIAVAELEGDLLKAVKSGNAEKTRSVYDQLVRARIALHRAEATILTDR